MSTILLSFPEQERRNRLAFVLRSIQGVTQTDVVKSSVEAVTMCKTSKYDVAVLYRESGKQLDESGVPHYKDGLAVLRDIQSGYVPTNIVILAGQVFSRTQQRVIEAGGVGAICTDPCGTPSTPLNEKLKTFEPEFLRTVVHELLKNSGDSPTLKQYIGRRDYMSSASGRNT